MEHVYKCKKLNDNENGDIADYNQLCMETCPRQIEIYRRFQQNYLKRIEIKNAEDNQINNKDDIKLPHVISSCDPLLCCSNGT